MNQKTTEHMPEGYAEPWYRVGMVWLVIALPLIVVVACMITINIAIKHSPKIIDPQSTSAAIGNVETQRISLATSLDKPTVLLKC